MSWPEFTDARQLLAEEGLGRHVRAQQQAARDAEDAVVANTTAVLAARQRAHLE